jgi:hypothetical protein
VELGHLQLLGRQPVHHVLQEQALICKARASRQHALLALQAPIQHRELHNALHVHLDSRVDRLIPLVVLLVMLCRSQQEIEALLAVHVQPDLIPRPLGHLSLSAHHAPLGLMGQVLDLLCALHVSQ